MVEPGLYRHYKGNMYRVKETAKHTETGEAMVIYERDGFLYARPMDSFKEWIEERAVPRFKKVDTYPVPDMSDHESLVHQKVSNRLVEKSKKIIAKGKYV